MLIDVGCTLTFCDGASIAAVAATVGVTASAAALNAAEEQIRAELERHVWASSPQSAAPPGGGERFYTRLLALAGATGDLDAAGTAVWNRHLEQNLWRRVGAGVPEALNYLNKSGIRLAAVSNSEGTVAAMLADVGLLPHFATVLDSWVVGVAKPDPRIFRLALDRLGVAADDAIMVGDSPSSDVAGAQAVGLRAVLIDPLGLHPTATVPRYPDFPAFTRSLLGG